MEQSVVHWEMMEFLPMKTLVVSHVMMAMSYLVVRLGPVRVLGPGVVILQYAGEVSSSLYVCYWLVHT